MNYEARAIIVMQRTCVYIVKKTTFSYSRLTTSAQRRVSAAYLSLRKLLTLTTAHLGDLNKGMLATLRAAHFGALNQALSSIRTFVRPNKRNDSRRRRS